VKVKKFGLGKTYPEKMLVEPLLESILVVKWWYSRYS